MRKMNKFIGVLIMVLTFTLLLTMPNQVLSLGLDPTFTLDTFDDWNSAPISPVLENYEAAFEHYTVMGGIDYMYTAPQLYVFEGDGSPETEGSGLVMAWGNSEIDLPQLAAWEYTYPEDPNLIGTQLNLTVMPPMGIWAVSLTLIDAAAGWNSWDWWVATPGNPLPLNPSAIPIAPNAPMIITIDPTIAANQSGSNNFAPAGFNPAIATTIQADELAANPGSWQQFPPVPVVGGQQPWNYWSNVSVTTPIPEPSTMLLLGSGLVGLGVFRKKFKKE